MPDLLSSSIIKLTAAGLSVSCAVSCSRSFRTTDSLLSSTPHVSSRFHLFRHCAELGRVLPASWIPEASTPEHPFLRKSCRTTLWRIDDRSRVLAHVRHSCRLARRVTSMSRGNTMKWLCLATLLSAAISVPVEGNAATVIPC